MADTSPAIGFSITVQLDDKHAIVAQTHVDQEAEPAQINRIIDKVMAAIQRKEDQGELEMWKRKLYSAQVNIPMKRAEARRSAEAAIDSWHASGKRGPYKPTVQDISAANTHVSQLERELETVKIAEERIAHLEAKLDPPQERHLKAV